MKEQKTTILQGDALETLRGLPAESVHCCITSPPYWGLRDYGVEGQIGLEPTPEEYIEKLVEVFREARRVLRNDGTCWVNMGDSYSGSGVNAGSKSPGLSMAVDRGSPDQRPGKTQRWSCPFKPKDLCGMPWRLAFALQTDGWWLRSDIIWSKPNPMPESVTDRPTKSHEYVFLLTKSVKYFWDQEAVREEAIYEGDKRHLRTDNSVGKVRDFSRSRQRTGTPTNGRNIRTVWTIPTQSFKKAHFATFPEKLVEPMIKAGTSEKGCCPECGKALGRVVEKTRSFKSGSGKSGNMPIGKHCTNLQGGGETLDIRRGPVVNSETIGFRSSCSCPEAKPLPCTVLDPFAGAFTVGVVAWRLGRSFIGIELSPEYVKMGKERLYSKASLFHQTLGGEKK